MKKETKQGIKEILVFFIFILFIFSFLYITMSWMYQGKDNACEDIGMEHKRLQGGDVCIDKFNNAHFVNIKCTGMFYWEKCKADIITIGDYRVVTE